MISSLFVCTALGAIVLGLALRSARADEKSTISLSFVLHVAAAFAIVAYHEYVFRGGDMFWYRFFGVQLARLMAADFLFYTPEVIKLALHIPNNLPLRVMLEGTSTGSMSAVSGLLLFATGENLYGASLLVSYFSFLGQLNLYQAARPGLDERERPWALMGMMLLPSAIFWSSGIVKEAFVLGALGFLCRGIVEVLLERRVLGLLRVAAGAVVVALFKPYVLFPFVLACGAWMYAGRKGKVSLVYKLIGVAVAIGGLLLMTRLYPEFGIDRLGETVAKTQEGGRMASVGAGSNIEMGDGDERTVAGQLKFLPLGLFNALARPLLFDVRNASTILAAVEMTALVGLLLALIFRYGFGRVMREIRSRPPYLFSVVFIVTFGAAVGIATVNLGTLSRYRVPMMPYYAGMLLGLRARLGARAPAAAGASPRGAPRRAVRAPLPPRVTGRRPERV